jgi:MarR family
LSHNPEFQLMTNHGNALLLIARDPDIRLRDIASVLGITERRAQRIVSDLVTTGYIERERIGRRNLYRVAAKLPLRLPFQGNVDLGSLLAILPTDYSTSS